ncbi:GIY-YIG nuclease family protein [Paenibacillus humicus]|uniref:GIY-YIG nuclease family protein n=1 Tax=Paenibacillus humicus TaxID=412861 RepID=UPI000FDAC0E1|nr:GIY-YIG nuclease family protein [Paenibacillus humicus]
MALDKQSKKELVSSYKQSFRPMGVYQIRNKENGKVLVCGSMDLPGAKNRLDFFKSTGMNTLHELKSDWKAYGAESFVFEELDQIKPREEYAGDPEELKGYQAEVDALLELWIEKLQPYGDKGYNKPKR